MEELVEFILPTYETLVTLLDLVKVSDVVELQEQRDELARSHVSLS